VHGSTSKWIAGDGARLFSRRWTPARPAKARVLLVHGIGEHSGRYEALVAHLCGAGYAVRAFDLRGHGRSEGRRGDTRFAPTFDDIDRLLDEERGHGLPLFLFGHSLGGLIVLAYGIERRPALAGVVASAAALHTAVREQRVKVLLTRLLGRVLPGVSVDPGLDATLLSRDPAVVEDYLGDPLVHRRMTLGLGRDAMTAIDRVLGHRDGFPAALLLLHGDADRVNYPSGSRHVAARLGERCTLREYPGVYHQPHTDPDSPRVFADLSAWLDRRL
jgi:alpha-beta hydrolase superfamily lysophospholipase